MHWSALWTIWRDYTLAVTTAAAAALSGYWEAAPQLMHIAAMALGPLLVIEAVSATWMQREARKSRAEPVPVTIYPGDRWDRAGLRFAMTLLLVALAAAVDVLLGTRHMTVLWVLLWGTGGHARASLRHLEVIAQLNHMRLPIFPDDRMARLDALTPSEGEEKKDE